MLRARRFSSLLNAPRCGVRSFWPVSLHSKKKFKYNFISNWTNYTLYAGHVFRKFPRFSGYSRPSSSTIRSALWENAQRSLAAVGLLLATAGGALLPTSVLSCSPRWSQEGQHQKTVTNCICKPKQHSWDACCNALCCYFKWFSSRAWTCNRFLHTCCSFVTLETAIKTLNLLRPKPSPMVLSTALLPTEKLSITRLWDFRSNPQGTPNANQTPCPATN